MKRKLIAVCLTLAMTAGLLAGCGGSAGDGSQENSGTQQTDGDTQQTGGGGQQSGIIEEPQELAPNTEKSDETLTVVLGGEPASLIVEGTAGSFSTPIRMLLGDRLLEYDDEKGEFVGSLLENWEIVDETHLRGTVRKGMIAYDGTEFNAHDVIFSLQKAQELAPNFLTSSLVVENCVAEDDYTVMFETSGTVMSAMGMMATGVNSMYDQSSFEAAGGEEGARTNPCWGVGKYNFVEWVPGQYILLERNENYWDPDYAGYYKNIKITFVSDNATRAMSIMSGTADIAPDIPLNSVSSYMDSEECDIIVLSNGNANGLSLNSSGDGPLSDVKVREAIRYAIDVNALNMVASGGNAPREDHFILSTSTYGFDPTGGAGVVYDVEKAKELLAEAGYGDGFELTLLAGTNEEEILTAIQSMLAEIGITANIEMPERSVMIPMAESGEYDIFYNGHPAALKYRNIDTFKMLSPEFAGAGKYMAGPKVQDPELQALIDTAVEELDDTVAGEAIHQIVQAAYDNVWYIGVEGGILTSMARKGITGVTLDAGACVDLDSIRPAN